MKGKAKDPTVPDYNDPFAPPKEVVEVRCLHCGETYPSSEMAWSASDGLWVCKNYASCGGAGYEFDIQDAVLPDGTRWEF